MHENIGAAQYCDWITEELTDGGEGHWEGRCGNLGSDGADEGCIEALHCEQARLSGSGRWQHDAM